MTTLTFNAADALGSTPGAEFSITLTDYAGNPIIGYIDDVVVFDGPRTVEADATGLVTVELDANALYDQDNTYYTVTRTITEQSVLILMTGTDATLAEVIAEDPDPLPPSVTQGIIDNALAGLTATDVGADPVGTAAALVEAEAIERAAADETIAEGFTQLVADEAALARDAGNLTSGTILDGRIPSGIARDTEVAQAITDHNASTAAHGIADTGNLVLTDDARLSDVRAPRTSAAARWQRAQVGGRHDFQRARVLVMADSYITIGHYNAVVGAVQETITGAESAFAGIAFTQPGDFTGGTTSQAGWNANAKLVAPGSPISVTFRLFAGAVVFFGAAAGGTLELYVAGVKVGETTTDTPGRLDVPSALAIAQTVELRAVGATIPVYGLWGSNTTPTSTSGVEMVLSGVAGLGIHTVVANALTESIDFAEAYDPDLLIIGHFINSTAEQYEAAMTTFLTAFREVCPTTSIAIVVGPITDGRPFAATQRTTAYDLAELFDGYVVDTQEVLGDITGSIYTVDGVHLSTAGGLVFTDRMVEGLALTGRPTNHAASHADGGSDELALSADQITSGTLADARIPSTITRDTELATTVSGAISAFALFRTAR